LTVTTELTAYNDDKGNRVEYDGPPVPNVKINFTGSNNRVVVAVPAKLRNLNVDLNCDNGTLTIGEHPDGPAFGGSIRVGQDSTVSIGRNVSSTNGVVISAVEGTTVTIGDDVMFASENQIRADDGHPIFDVTSGKRVNRSRDITIGNHVWLAWGATVLGGAAVGDGTVIGYGSVVTRSIPNNCVAAGIPAKVVRRNIAWERPHLSLTKPYYKPDASTVKKSAYWNLTEEPARPAPRPVWERAAGRMRRAATVLLKG
jgi:acetyltransferase-like isoleucine patch superfamily enzyme